MRRLFGILAIAGLAWPALAPSQAKDDVSAVVRNVERALAGLTTLRADFEQTYYSTTIAAPRHEKGRLYLARPDRMRWEYGPPAVKIMVYADGLFQAYDEEEKQLIRKPVPPEEAEADILGLLLGKARLEERYAAEPAEFPGRAPGARQIKLTPRVESETSYVLLEVDGRDWLLRRAVLFDWAGNKNEFAFSRVRTGLKLDPGLFTLKVPPGTEIIDEAPPRKK